MVRGRGLALAGLLLDDGDAPQPAALPLVGPGPRAGERFLAVLGMTGLVPRQGCYPLVGPRQCPGERFLAVLGMTGMVPRQGCYPLWVQGRALVSLVRSADGGALARAA